MVATADAKGYYLVASDGGVFCFGDATYQGSMGSTPLQAPVVSMALDRVTGGYWLGAADGGIFSFNAPFFGSGVGAIKPLPTPAGKYPPLDIVVSITATPDGGGYWLLVDSNEVISKGDATGVAFDM